MRQASPGGRPSSMPTPTNLQLEPNSFQLYTRNILGLRHVLRAWPCRRLQGVVFGNISSPKVCARRFASTAAKDIGSCSTSTWGYKDKPTFSRTQFDQSSLAQYRLQPFTCEPRTFVLETEQIGQNWNRQHLQNDSNLMSRRFYFARKNARSLDQVTKGFPFY